MARPWFHVGSIPGEGETVRLDREEARHAGGSRRLGPGDEIVLFDGRGMTAGALLEAGAAPRGAGVQARVTSTSMQPLPSPALHLASALPRGDRQSVLLSMATQLGMRSFTPLRCRHGVAEASEGFRRRAERWCLEACKQSRRAHLPPIEEPRGPAEAAAEARARGRIVWIAHRPGRSLAGALRAIPKGAELLVLVGPEGGFTEDEVEGAVGAGAAPVELGEGTLRIETAAVALVAAAMLAGERET